MRLKPCLVPLPLPAHVQTFHNANAIYGLHRRRSLSMEVALTFGSLGDIIQLCQLAIQLGRAVGVGCGAAGGGSTREYQHLRHDLDVLVRVLMQASWPPFVRAGLSSLFCSPCMRRRSWPRTSSTSSRRVSKSSTMCPSRSSTSVRASSKIHFSTCARATGAVSAQKDPGTRSGI